MVSSLRKFFRPRSNHNKHKKVDNVYKTARVDIPCSSTVSENGTRCYSDYHETFNTNTELELNLVNSRRMTPEATRIQEVMLERQNDAQRNGKIDSEPPVMGTEAEPVDSCGFRVNLHNSIKDALNQLPSEYKGTAFNLSLVFISLMGLFFSIVFYRYLHNLYVPAPEGWFCRNFAELFEPLFDSLCDIEPMGGFFHEMRRNSEILAGELRDATSYFIRSIFDGFHAFGLIFTKMIQGFVGNINDGIHELMDNVHRNIEFLVRFCSQFVHALTYFIIRCVQSISTMFHTVSEETE